MSGLLAGVFYLATLIPAELVCLGTAPAQSQCTLLDHCPRSRSCSRGLDHCGARLIRG